MSDQGSPARPWYDAVVTAIALKGWTKAQLSERSGVSRPAIDNWRTNPKPPQARSVNAVADVLGIPRERALRLAGIITTEADRSPPRSAIDEKLGAKASEFREAMRRLYGPDADRRLRDVEEDLSQPPADDDDARRGPGARRAPR